MANARVLVVEDNKFVRHSLIALLRTSGVEVAAFDTLAAAARQLDSGWDGMIIDQRLPDGDGADFALEILERHPDIPIVLYTAAEYRDVAAVIGGSSIVYAQKPDGVDVIRGMIAQWTRRAMRGARPASVERSVQGNAGVDSPLGDDPPDRE